jgi:hypothetical protein
VITPTVKKGKTCAGPIDCKPGDGACPTISPAPIASDGTADTDTITTTNQPTSLNTTTTTTTVTADGTGKEPDDASPDKSSKISGGTVAAIVLVLLLVISAVLWYGQSQKAIVLNQIAINDGAVIGMIDNPMPGRAAAAGVDGGANADPPPEVPLVVNPMYAPGRDGGALPTEVPLIANAIYAGGGPPANGAIYMVGGEPQQQQRQGQVANGADHSTIFYAVPGEEWVLDPMYSGDEAPPEALAAAGIVYAQPVDGAAGADRANTINRPTDSNNVYDPWGVSPATSNTSTNTTATATTTPGDDTYSGYAPPETAFRMAPNANDTATAANQSNPIIYAVPTEEGSTLLLAANMHTVGDASAPSTATPTAVAAGTVVYDSSGEYVARDDMAGGAGAGNVNYKVVDGEGSAAAVAPRPAVVGDGAVMVGARAQLQSSTATNASSTYDMGPETTQQGPGDGNGVVVHAAPMYSVPVKIPKQRPDENNVYDMQVPGKKSKRAVAAAGAPASPMYVEPNQMLGGATEDYAGAGTKSDQVYSLYTGSTPGPSASENSVYRTTEAAHGSGEDWNEKESYGVRCFVLE